MKPKFWNSEGFRTMTAVVVALVMIGGIYWWSHRLGEQEEVHDPEVSEVTGAPSKTREVKIVDNSVPISKETYLSASPIHQDLHAYHAECLQLLQGPLINDCEEGFVLPKYPEVKRVSSECLSVPLKTGTYVKLCNLPLDGNIDAHANEVRTYRLWGYVSGLGYLFRVGYYEGSGRMIINENTGEQMQVYGEPAWSPSKKRFVAMEIGGIAYGQDRFHIWEKSGDTYEVIYEQGSWPQHMEYEVVDPVWINEDTFYFIKRKVQYGYPDPNDPNRYTYYDEPKNVDEYASFTLTEALKQEYLTQTKI